MRRHSVHGGADSICALCFCVPAHGQRSGNVVFAVVVVGGVLAA